MRELSFKKWSEREDSNFRPPQPHCGALPGCATLRLLGNYYSSDVYNTLILLEFNPYLEKTDRMGEF